MTSSNRARRYLQHQKQYIHEHPRSTMIDSSTIRKFRGKTQVSIPQICVNNNDDDNGHVDILNQFDQILDEELKHSTVQRTCSLKQEIDIPNNQQRSFSFALGSQDKLDHTPVKSTRFLSASKSSLSKEKFSRLFHSLAFRSASNSSSKIFMKRTDSQSRQQACLACQNYPELDFMPKNKKRPSIFGVLVSKLNTSISSETNFQRCSVCKRILSKSISINDHGSSKHLRVKRRQSLPSLLHNLVDSSSFASTSNHLFESITPEQSARSSMESVDGNSFRRQTDESMEKNGNETNEMNTIDSGGECHDLNSIQSNESMMESNNNQQFLHPPDSDQMMRRNIRQLNDQSQREFMSDLKQRREKTRSLLINVFRARRSNAGLTSTESPMTGKQLSISVSNLTTSLNTHRRNSAVGNLTESTDEQRKHALSDESLPSMDNTYIYFTNIHGRTFKEKLHYSNISEETTLKEMLLKIFEKHRLPMDAYHICLRSAPTLPLSLNQPVKHLLLNDLIVTDSTNQVLSRSSAGKERNEKRNSTGSAILSPNCKSTAKRLSNHYTMFDNDETPRGTNKSARSSIFTSSIFTRDVMESTENNLAFVRRQCDEWLAHGLPKLAQLQCSINENDLNIEKDWQRFLSEQTRTTLPEMMKLQQETIYEMLSTEVSYIRQILTMTDVFMTSISILKSSERDGIFQDIDMDKLFSNIQDVLQGNLLFWKEILLPMKIKLEQTGLPMNPSDLKTGFLQFDIYFKPYLHYVLDQKTSAEYFKQKFTRDDLFQYLITWIEANFTNRLSFADLTIKPLQRLTRYKLLLEAIQKKTSDLQQRNDLHEMIDKVATFVNRINSKLHKQEQEERIRQINDRIGPYENISAPPELTSILQEYQRDSIMSNRLDLLQDMPLHIQGYRRQIIQQGPMKMKDAKNSQDVYCYLFSDMFLITKGGKRSGSTNSSSCSTTNVDGQTNRSIPIVLNKILKSPIRIDRIDVREYDRRGGNAEPNTASFVALIFSEYNLIECAYLFQTNLSKQWIENIRQTKLNFQLLMEESKLKFQNLNHASSPPPRTSVSTNTIHQSLPSLTSPCLNLKLNELTTPIDDHPRSSKVESDVFKIVEQTRRNSRTDRKNFGRYFTADGTSTNPSSSSPTKQISSSSTAILKRMSWNNEQIMEKTDSSLITNSFRSVHSSSGVSSTGSFLFSTDEDSSMTTTTTTTSSSIPSMTPVKDENNLSSDTQSSTNQTIIESSPEFSLRRTPFPSIKKRHRRQKIFPDNDVHSSTHTIVYESAKSIEENSSSFITSGNESDYDNNQSPIHPKSNNHLLYADELSLGDQNEITLNNITHFEHLNSNQNHSQSDTMKISLTRISPPETFDESPPTSFLTYHRDPLITRRLLDIRSHLLLNTTLDATEV